MSKAVRAYQMVMEGHSVEDGAAELGVDRATVYRYLKRLENDLPSVEKLREQHIRRHFHFLTLFAGDFHAAAPASLARTRIANSIVSLLRETSELLGFKHSRETLEILAKPTGAGIRITDVPIDKVLEQGRAKMMEYMKERGMLK